MGVRWLCKNSVHGKKSPLPKGDLVDRLTVQNNGFGLGGTEKKSGEGYYEVFTSRTTIQQDEGFLSYVQQLFPNYNFFLFFFMFMILQILTSAKGEERSMNIEGKVLQNCGAASVGEYNRVTYYYQLS